MTWYKSFVALLVLLAMPQLAMAQVKYERECRIRAEWAPRPAVSFIDSLGIAGKVKWYSEESHEGISIEAKYRHNKTRYSIEFDTAGNVLEAEYVINRKEIPREVLLKIEATLDSLFTRWKYRKIQYHLEGSAETLFGYLRNKEPSDEISVSYEMVLDGKDSGMAELYEMTFDDRGKMIEKLIIVRRSATNLEY